MSDPKTAKNIDFSVLPSVDQLLRTAAAARLRDLVGLQRTTDVARNIVETLRSQIQSQEAPETDNRDNLLSQSVKQLEDAWRREKQSGIRRVINATGVVVHTNLGRAPLSLEAREAIFREASGYCTLEYDSESGSRGRRGAYVEQLLIELTGAEDALVVNNCAAAALLILTVLARDGETIVSRGELIEIGGDFRVPDVMANSGTRMIEVGTTNRTRLDDYKKAITAQTRLLMRVHPSNYRIVGFTDSPRLSELALLAHKSDLALFVDAGSGALSDLSAIGLGDEPIIKDCISAGADVVCFSGDKLLGAAQAGLIVGRREIIGRLRTNSFYRALRVDKLALAALEATLEAHRRGTVFEDTPALQMLSLSQETLAERARKLQELLVNANADLAFEISLVDGESAVGGGSGPNTHPRTTLISLRHKTLSALELQHRLRQADPPVITRVADSTLLIDLRTVAEEEESELIEILRHLA